jgi:16S rRNA processing protein RimM
MISKQFSTLGVLVKAHGVNGSAILRTDFIPDEELFETEWVFLKIDGKPVPFFVDKIQPRNNESVLIHFEGITTTQQIERWINFEVLIEGVFEIDNDNSDNEYIGFIVEDKSLGNLGKVAEVIDIPGNPLIRIEGEKEILIPLQADYILKINEKKKTISVKLPDGLLNMDEAEN